MRQWDNTKKDKSEQWEKTDLERVLMTPVCEQECEWSVA